jgi:hypothetical protein
VTYVDQASPVHSPQSRTLVENERVQVSQLWLHTHNQKEDGDEHTEDYKNLFTDQERSNTKNQSTRSPVSPLEDTADHRGGDSLK